jgi:ABC-type branched-chain amino acid transport system, permease component
MAIADTKALTLTDKLYQFFEDPRRQLILMAVIVAMLIFLPLLTGRYYTTIMTNAMLYVVLALGLNVVVGYAGLLDLGYAAFFAVGAYSIGILTVQFDWNFWLAIPPALLAACMAGVIIGGPTLRLRSDYLAIVTLGFGEIVRFSARNLEITGRASGLSNIPEPSLLAGPLMVT